MTSDVDIIDIVGCFEYYAQNLAHAPADGRVPLLDVVVYGLMANFNQRLLCGFSYLDADFETI